MGRKRFRKGGDRRGGGGGGGNQPRGERQAQGDRYISYPAITRENERLQRFYDTLLELPESEKPAFWAALRRELPNSFRFCGSKGHALVVRNLLQTRYIPELIKITHHDGREVDAPQPVPWYPDSLAWSMTTPKQVIRKFPPFARFQKFLVSETSVGNMSRQEVVSMIPPLFMDLRPGMTALDMCAAPGSKAAQLLEMIHSGEEGRVRRALRAFANEDALELGEETEEEKTVDMAADPNDDGRATGLLIANDSDYKRAHLLVHQLKRLSSPNMIVSNHDATMFPSIRVPQQPDGSKWLKFDRILADVPCSGDGTLRKNVGLWKDWQPGNALGLFVTQVRILTRALQLLKVGGRVVYSTCSMNPVENEAVITSAIERCGGSDAIEILDCASELPELKRVPGFRKWKIMDKSSRIWSSWQQVEEWVKASEAGIYPGRIIEQMFPRPDGSECADLPLERCMRFYAHLQDTGAFFVTVLEKKTEFKAAPDNLNRPNEANTAASVATNGAKADNGLESAANGLKRQREEDEDAELDIKKPKTEGTEAKVEETAEETEEQPALDPNGAAGETSLTIDSEGPKQAKKENGHAGPNAAKVKPSHNGNSMAPAKKAKGFNEEPFIYLPSDHEILQNITKFYNLSSRFPRDRWMVRNATGEPAKAIYYTTALGRDILTENKDRGVKFIHAGVRMFMKQDAPSAEVCRWRIQNEGMPIVQGYVGEQRVVHLHHKETLRKLLIEMFPKLSEGDWVRFDEIGERVRDIGMGCCVLRVEPEAGTDDPEFGEQFALPLWKSLHSLNLMLPKEDRAAMLLRIFDDTTPLVNMSIQKSKEARRVGQEGEHGEAAEGDDGAADPDVDVDADATMEGVEEGGGEGVAEEIEEAAAEIKGLDDDAIEDLPTP